MNELRTQLLAELGAYVHAQHKSLTIQVPTCV